MITKEQVRVLQRLMQSSGATSMFVLEYSGIANSPIMAGLLAETYVRHVSDGWLITDAGRAALAEYEARTASNARDELARQMHDPATMDDGELNSILSENTISAKEFKQIVDEIDARGKLQARIRELEAENEAYRDALEPFADAVAYDADIKSCTKYTGLRILDGKSGTLQILVDEVTKLSVGHLRAAAEVYARYTGSGDA